ncbi:MAG: glutamate racemase, partial [Bacteroidota bacterium]|nr:glutamate racemase [Bacteroidota bacterium]
MTDKFQPIGVFDSGYGGLTILKEFIQDMPKYDFV